MAEEREDATVAPRDARIVRSLLNSMGVEEYEPRVIHQFLELWYRYAVDVLSDAQRYSDHAGKSSVDADDVTLAIQSKVNSSFSQPSPREVVLELTRNRNKIPLPKWNAGSSVPLPPEHDTLIAPNYQLAVLNKRPAMEETEEDDEGANPGLSQEVQTDMQLTQQQATPQRVGFPLAKQSK